MTLTFEVYERFRTHFTNVHPTEIFAAARSAFPNKTRKQYRQHALISNMHRLWAAEDSADAVKRYYIERQPTGYAPQGYGLLARKPVMPTANELRCIELVTDFLLAEDHAAGLLLTDRFREESDEHCLEFPPLGGAARAYQEMELNFLAPAILKHRKVCESCLSYFIDTSRAKNAKRCGPRCLRWSEMIRSRTLRGDGDSRRQRDRERQQHEYPFYSPYELEHLNKYPERAYTDESIDRKVVANNRGGRKKPQGVTMDSPAVTGHYKAYNPRTEGESGPEVVRQKRPEVIARYLRMKYGIGHIPRTDIHRSETENTSSCVDIFMAAV